MDRPPRSPGPVLPEPVEESALPVLEGPGPGPDRPASPFEPCLGAAAFREQSLDATRLRRVPVEQAREDLLRFDLDGAKESDDERRREVRAGRPVGRRGPPEPLAPLVPRSVGVSQELRESTRRFAPGQSPRTRSVQGRTRPARGRGWAQGYRCRTSSGLGRAPCAEDGASRTDGSRRRAGPGPCKQPEGTVLGSPGLGWDAKN